MLSLSAIFRLNNFFIKKILFDAEGLLYIFDRAVIKFWVVFSLETLSATVDDMDNWITLGFFDLRCLTRRWSSPSASGPFHQEKDRDILVQVIFDLHLLEFEVRAVELFDSDLSFFCHRES